MRSSIFLVMVMWTLDKLINPDHAAQVFAHFYFIPGVTPGVMNFIGSLELILLAAFVTGYQKKWSYGAVLVFHAISTVSSLPVYFDPFAPGHLLFFAAWPMLAACFTLFILREHDTRWAIDKA